MVRARYGKVGIPSRFVALYDSLTRKVSLLQPRAWLNTGERAQVANVPLSNGARVGLSIESTLDEGGGDGGSFKVNVTLRARGGGAFAWPSGGVVVRLRSPQWPARTIAAATVAGRPWPHINATDETVVFARAPPSLADMQDIVVTLST